MPLLESNRCPHSAWDNSQSAESHPPGQNIPFSLFWKLLHRELVGVGATIKIDPKMNQRLKSKTYNYKTLRRKIRDYRFPQWNT